jgi:hypothetical protein
MGFACRASPKRAAQVRTTCRLSQRRSYGACMGLTRWRRRTYPTVASAPFRADYGPGVEFAVLQQIWDDNCG